MAFMQNYLDDFDASKLSESLTLSSFDKDTLYSVNRRNQREHELCKISSNSGLRKVYDSYLDTGLDNTKIQIWFAKVGYQEKRKNLPGGFLKFINGIYNKLDQDNEKFKDFMEVFVAYHKYFNPSAN